MMRYREFDEPGIPEVGPELEEELSEIDIPSELKFWNLVFCVGLVIGVLLGCWCIISKPSVIDTNPEIFFFTLFYISVEVACTLVSIIAFLIFWAISYVKNKRILVSDYIGILSVCSFTLSNMAHLLAIPIGCLLLARNPTIDIPYKTFICFQIFFAVFILGKFIFGRGKTNGSYHIEPSNSEAIIKATAEIENIRSRGNSVHSLQNSFQGGREIRSTSNYESKRSEDGDAPRERSVSTGTKLRLKAPKVKTEETNRYPN
ncbi:hypothetical protein SteCoe_32057 [Stentor coeruleus]|uniref:Uncharacterized protein n=1 Tax=Stentor coeruleus TaxID=5963 RepID=A0A1R2B020_9CILI|nr:hypothetical protein SteCoe_32057 [Stentor coeruleus]